MPRKGEQTDEDRTGDSGYTFQQQRELFEMQMALEREKAKLKQEADERAVQAARETAEASKETADAQYKVLQIQLELERQKQLTDNNNRINPVPLPHFNVKDATVLLPSFNDSEIETYLVNFEKLAIANAWPRRHWANILIPVLKGNKALRAFNRLDANSINNYDDLKTAVLEEYSLVPEVYRAHFRNCVRRQGDNYADFSVYLSNQFERWVSSKQIAGSYDNLKQLMLVEQFMNKVPDDVREHLIDKGCNTLQDCARKADEYIALHKSMKHGQRSMNSAQSKESNRPDSSNSGKVNRNNIQSNYNQTYNHVNQAKQNNPSNYVICHYCHKPGHVVKDCYARKRDNEKQVGCVIGYDNSVVSRKKNSCNYVHSACVCSVNSNGKECVDIFTFRDTGADICLLKEGAVPEHMLKPVNSYVQIKGILGVSDALNDVPVYSIHVKSVFVMGEICVALVPNTCNLPNNVQLLIGNDYGKAMLVENGTDNIVGAVTRSQTSKENKLVQETSVDNVVDVADKSVPVTEVSVSASTNSRPIIDDEGLAESLHNLYDENICVTDKTESVDVIKLGELQKQDTSLAHLFIDLPNSRSYYVRDNGLLCRRYIDHKSQETINQIVIPYVLRGKILLLSHSVPASGHLGRAKTQKRILRYFFWPGLNKDVKEYCRSCDVCQRTMRACKPVKVPMQKPPIVEKPFGRVSIDIVGALPETTRGNKYILCLVDHSTRWAEAYALPNQQSSTIIRAIIDFMSRFGIPDDILHDLGADFTSELFQVVLSYFGVNCLKCSVGHPQTNTAVERFNGTLKGMLTTYLKDFKGEWDEALPFVLFAYRELPVSEFGFSPYELIFGRHIKGPTCMLFDNWWEAGKDKASPNVIEYMLNLRDKVEHALNIVHDEQRKAQNKGKAWYDKNARSIEYVVDENVLVLSTQPKKPLCLQYEGPYKIIKKVSPVDYLVSFPGKRKPERVLHVNLLRKYIPRTEFVGVINGEQRNIDYDIDECLDGIECIAGKNCIADKFDEKLFKEKIAHLNVNQGIKIRDIVNKYSQVISDKPGCCKDFLYKICLKPEARPAQSRPYRLSPSQHQWLREEINELIIDGLIEPSCSEWASPTLVVPKPEAGKFRCVIDYRKANPLIEGDSFPMARVDDLLDRIGQATVLSKFDLCKGFYQVLLDETSRPITSFCTPFGVFQWKRLPMGLKISPAAFNAMLAKVLSGLEDICGLYLDDIVVFSKSWEEHLRHIELIFQRLKNYGLTIKLSKCFFACPEIEFLGHMVGFGTVSPKQLKVMDLLNTMRPEGKRQLQSWLGLSGYYQRYIPKYAELTAPLTDLLKKDVKFNWTAKADKSFNEIKCLLAQKPVLKIADFSKPFVIFVDASSVASAAILMQTGENGVLHPISYYSKKHNKSQLNYTTTDLEALAMVLAVRAFRIYLSGATTIYTDHEALHYIHNNATKNKRLLRWSMELQQFDLKVEHVKGKNNIFADYLSRHVSNSDVLCLSEVNLDP